MIPQQDKPATTVMMWLKDMLAEAWKREIELKGYIKSVVER